MTSESAWLAARKNGIGASECAALFDASPYMSALQLFYDKAGLAEHIVEETEQMRWGKLLEPVIAQEYTRQSGYEVTLNGREIHWSKEHPWLFATPDGFIETERGRGVLELKLASGYAEGWDLNRPPLHYQIQIAHQMLATGCTWGVVVCLDSYAMELRTWECVQAPELAAAIVKRGAEFWRKVEAARTIVRTGKQATGALREIELSLGPGARDLATIQRVHSKGTDMADLTEHAPLLSRWALHAEAEKEHAEKAKGCKAQALVLAGESDTITCWGLPVASRDKRGAWRMSGEFRKRAAAFDAAEATTPNA